MIISRIKFDDTNDYEVLLFKAWLYKKRITERILIMVNE